MGSVPTWDRHMAPSLRVLSDGEVRRARQIVEAAADLLGVTPEQRQILIPSEDDNHASGVHCDQPSPVDGSAQGDGGGQQPHHGAPVQTMLGGHPVTVRASARSESTPDAANRVVIRARGPSSSVTLRNVRRP